MFWCREKEHEVAIDHLANDDFERAVVKGFWRKVLSWLTGQSNELLPFDEVRERLPIRGQRYIGHQQVSINQIVGSLGRYKDFDRAFLPTQKRTKMRWVNVDKAHYQQVVLPPIELFKIGELYFVKDGNHRVSVARERGQEFIDAFVTEIQIPFPLTPETDLDELQIKKEQVEFLEQTGLDKSHPGAVFDARMPGQYRRLLEHIHAHRYYLGEKLGYEPSLEEAADSWYDNVYIPLVRAMREQRLQREFPDAPETDLYLWIITYQWYLRQAYVKEENITDQPQEGAVTHEAARRLVEHEAQSPPMLARLVNVLKNADWVYELILNQDRAAFLERTHILELRPEARIETDVPGQYQKLLEHIDVHRWYLGEQRRGEVPYQEAVASWYDLVYLPLVKILREQNLLEAFPRRTETDLYIWTIARQAYLDQTYGDEISPEQAAKELSLRAQERKPKRR